MLNFWVWGWRSPQSHPLGYATDWASSQNICWDGISRTLDVEAYRVDFYGSSQAAEDDFNFFHWCIARYMNSAIIAVVEVVISAR